MDKNISGVDLEELKKAREELDKEQGVESDPDMYKDYNPNREEISLENSQTDAFDSEEGYENISENIEDDSTENSSDVIAESTTKSGSSLDNLSKFDAFSAFEVKENSGLSSQNKPETNPAPTTSKDESDIDDKFESIRNIDEFDALLDELLSTEDIEEEDLKSSETKQEPVSENLSAVTEIDIEPKFESLEESETDQNKVDDESEEDDKVEDEENEIETNLNIAGNSTNETILNVNELNDYAEVEPQEETKEELVVENTEPEFVYQKPSKFDELGNQETEIITDYSKLREILQNELKESDEAEEDKINQSKPSPFKPIEDFKFINEIVTDEFKQADPFSYIMGKNELGQTVYGNFKHHFNLAVFGKNEQVINSFLNSMMLSLCLKNNCHILNFVLLDSNINSSFEVYNKSSYLYFNRIAKTNKEILDTLIEITKELDDRYQKFATVGVKNIEAFNDISLSAPPMPYIFLVFNNYTSASQATNSDKINSCLYQILKFGRICGIYAVVTASSIIETSQINYNLSSRLSFKSKEDSRFTVGIEDGNLLPEDSDALYFNIASGDVEHIKTATITDMELDLIIKDLEE